MILYNALIFNLVKLNHYIAEQIKYMVGVLIFEWILRIM